MKRTLVAILAGVSIGLTACGGGTATTHKSVSPSTACVPGHPGVCAVEKAPKLSTRAPLKLSGSQGVDISIYQGYPNWSAAKANGLGWVINQTNDGAARDYNFATNWIRERSVGLPHGAYLFARPGCASCQAATLASLVHAAGGMDSKALPPTIDAEVSGSYWNVCAIAQSLKTFLHVSTVITYTSPGLWPFGAPNCGTKLWTAVWGSAPYPASSWTFSQIVAQQWCGIGCYFPGVPGQVDRDVNMGILNYLGPPPPPTPAQYRTRLHNDYKYRSKLRYNITVHDCRIGKGHHARPNHTAHERKVWRHFCNVELAHGNNVNADLKALHAKGYWT